jgi:hypothetical protein
MATLHMTTTSSPVAVTDEEAVQALLVEWGVEPSNTGFEDGRFFLYGHAGFNAFPEYRGDPRTAAFLHAFREHFVDGAEWEVQAVGNEKCRHPLVAYRYRVTPDAVYYSDLYTDEHRIDADGDRVAEAGSVSVYAVVVHPPDATSSVANVYADREAAEQARRELRSERQGIDVAIEEYRVDA